MKITIFLAFIIVIYLFLGCAKSEEDPQCLETLVTGPEEPNNNEDPENTLSLPTESTIVFDFAELNEEGFPRGMWTGNRLIDKYGFDESLIGYFSPSSGSVVVNFIHKDIRVIFTPVHFEQFPSFCESIKGKEINLSEVEGAFELSEQEKNIELLISGLWFYDNIAEFPRGINIGKSTKQDVIDAYPEEPAFTRDFQIEDNYFYVVNYLYASSEIYHDLSEDNLELYFNGEINYIFDEKDLLWRVDIYWFPGD